MRDLAAVSPDGALEVTSIQQAARDMADALDFDAPATDAALIVVTWFPESGGQQTSWQQHSAYPQKLAGVVLKGVMRLALRDIDGTERFRAGKHDLSDEQRAALTRMIAEAEPPDTEPDAPVWSARTLRERADLILSWTVVRVVRRDGEAVAEIHQQATDREQALGALWAAASWLAGQ